MKRRTQRPRARVGLLAGALVAVVLIAGCARDLAVTPAGGTSRAYGVNLSGWVAGARTFPDGRTEGFLHRPGQTVTPLLPPTGYRNAEARAVNDAGVVVGRAFLPTAATAPTVAVWWDATGAVHRLPDRGGRSEAVDINEQGTIVGNAEAVATSGPTGGPVVWATPTGAPIVLSILSSAFGGAWATAINDVGTVVGHQTVASEDDHALRWSGPSYALTDVAPTQALNFVIPLDINNQGDIVGVWGSPGVIDPTLSLARPMIIPADGSGLRLLPGLSGPGAGAARSIDDSGVIVGDAIVGGQTHAVRWAPGPTGALVPTDLGTLGGADSSAWSIGDGGDIAGWSLDDAGDPGRRASAFHL